MNSTIKNCNYIEIIYPAQQPQASFINCLDHYGPFPDLEIDEQFNILGWFQDIITPTDAIEWS